MAETDLKPLDSSAIATSQDNHDKQQICNIKVRSEDVAEEARKTVHDVAGHLWSISTGFAQLLILLSLFVLSRLGISQNLLYWLSPTRRTSHLPNSIASHYRRSFQEHYLRVIAVWDNLRNLWQKLERISGQLEEHAKLLKSARAYNGPQDRAYHSADTTLTSHTAGRVREHSPVAASEVYHAALTNNKGLDDLLSAFNDRRALDISHLGAMHSETDREIALPPWSVFEPRSAGSGKIKTGCPPQYAQPGVCDGMNVPLDCANASDSSLSMASSDVLASSPCHGKGSKACEPGPSGTREHESNKCTACDRRASDSELKVAARKKPEFDTSIEPYHTVPGWKSSKIPTRSGKGRAR